MAHRVIDWRKVGAKVLDAAIEKGWSDARLAEEAGLSQATVCKVFNGYRVSIQSLLDILEPLNLTPDYVLGYWDGDDDG